MKKQLFILLVMCIALSFAACRAPNNAQADTQNQTTAQLQPASAMATLDAGAIAEAFSAHRNLPQVQGSGIVVKVLKDDTKGLKHQKFLLKVSDNITILIAHNLDFRADLCASNVQYRLLAYKYIHL